LDVAGYIDHTNLKPDTGQKGIIKLCEEAARWGFFSVCVNSCHVALASRFLSGTGVKVCSVVGFPLGAGSTEAKACEAELAANDGAAEIDMVINIGALKDGRYDFVREDINRVAKLASNCTIKVILETCLLTESEKERACSLVVEAGAHFVKTSTGFSTGGANASDVKLLRKAVGADFGVKASGGVRNLAGALEMIKAGANRLGTSASVAICEEMRQIENNFKDIDIINTK